MRVTRKQLRRIIQEEISRIEEAPGGTGGLAGTRDPVNQHPSKSMAAPGGSSPASSVEPADLSSSQVAGFLAALGIHLVPSFMEKKLNAFNIQLSMFLRKHPEVQEYWHDWVKAGATDHTD